MNKFTECFDWNEIKFTPLMAIEEASRCLLCYDAPCSKACPAGTNPAKFIRSLRFRNFKGAVETIRENNVLGGICSRVCPTSEYCQGACSRSGIDKPIQIGKLQTYLTDYESNIKMKVLEAIECDKEKVAVIGSGPSGLAAAAELAKERYKVTIFEAKDKFGGWLTYGIPSNKLPQVVVNNEIEYIKSLGVEFKNNCKIGKDITIDELKKQGFKAFLLAIGMQNAKIPNIQGINLKGVLKGTEFLSQVKTNKSKVELGKKVIVIGGGDVAIDCAITSRLLGAKDVKIVYRRTLEKMPANKEELTYTQKYNIPIFTGFKPYEIMGQDGKVIKFRAQGMFDDSELELPADTIIFAIGQEVHDVKTIANLDISESGSIKNLNYETSIEGVFVSGDIVDGDKTVVYAVKKGKEAAKSIENYLEKEGAR